ncbi:MarR family winged helix-turn-helix transcriptional regulator [Paenibacillus pasadenensis]|uniref:Transcriptional regulator, MarR family n=1 Tax=Paenibacillus pasadenensis TaxID=217090 RepID=A0A2N5N1L9_9BACL|nr:MULTISPECIES: MarR family transcriptional regulator [Paenibacillus]PLT44231.1 Transcriptional regulator, MarR family [Paenibacillus pasadenensis]QGG54757.1 MarR family transcriptional regulator [Paenibacillus sp. B01]
MDYKQLAEEMFEHVARASKPAFEESGQFSRGEMGILLYLLLRKNGASAGELSESLSVSTGRIASALKTLEKKGMILRCTDSEDRRRVLVYYTDAGKKFLIDRRAEHIAQTEQMLSRLSERDAREFVRLVKLLMP